MPVGGLTVYLGGGVIVISGLLMGANVPVTEVGVGVMSGAKVGGGKCRRCGSANGREAGRELRGRAHRREVGRGARRAQSSKSSIIFFGTLRLSKILFIL